VLSVFAIGRLHEQRQKQQQYSYTIPCRVMHNGVDIDQAKQLADHPDETIPPTISLGRQRVVRWCQRQRRLSIMYLFACLIKPKSSGPQHEDFGEEQTIGTESL
jgi:hypothetical protein